MTFLKASGPRSACSLMIPCAAGPSKQLKTGQSFNKTSQFRSCVRVEVAVLGSPPLIDRTVSVDVKQH